MRWSNILFCLHHVLPSWLNMRKWYRNGNLSIIQCLDHRNIDHCIYEVCVQALFWKSKKTNFTLKKTDDKEIYAAILSSFSTLLSYKLFYSDKPGVARYFISLLLPCEVLSWLKAALCVVTYCISRLVIMAFLCNWNKLTCVFKRKLIMITSIVIFRFNGRN